MRRFTTLRAGGMAERLAICRSVEDLCNWALESQKPGARCLILGMGSNALPSDDGVPGTVIVNEAREIEIRSDGSMRVSTGLAFQDLFLKTAQAGLGGLEYAVGIPGTIGGALVSNAGAYRSCISEFLTRVDVVLNGKREWVEPEALEFSYRDSVLRRHPDTPLCLLQVEMKLEFRDPLLIYNEAREYQRQRISKQPPPSSCGSFFKNITDRALAETISSLRQDLKDSGVIPAGVLMEQVGLKGLRHRGAMFSDRHANFMMNVGNASATSIRSLAEHAVVRVYEQFGVHLEEEVLYVGDWSMFEAETVAA